MMDQRRNEGDVPLSNLEQGNVTNAKGSSPQVEEPVPPECQFHHEKWYSLHRIFAPTVMHIACASLFVFFFFYGILIYSIPAHSFYHEVKTHPEYTYFAVPRFHQVIHWVLWISILCLLVSLYFFSSDHYIVYFTTLVGIIFFAPCVVTFWIMYPIYVDKDETVKLSQKPHSHQWMEDHWNMIAESNPEYHLSASGEYQIYDGEEDDKYRCSIMPIDIISNDSHDTSKWVHPPLKHFYLRVNVEAEWDPDVSQKLDDLKAKYTQFVKASKDEGHEIFWKFDIGTRVNGFIDIAFISNGELPLSKRHSTGAALMTFWGGIAYWFRVASIPIVTQNVTKTGVKVTDLPEITQQQIQNSLKCSVKGDIL